jgi:light-regulated signal transduction histidine kinase (bacteriophytochrome)
VDTTARAKIVEAIRLHGAVRNVEIQLRTKANTTVDVLLSVEQVELNGQTCGLTIQYDITDFKNAEREILRLNADLEQRQAGLELLNKELESFSYSVAHDLRTPLRSIDGFSQVLVEDYASILGTEGQKYLQHVREAAQHMSQLIDDLLMLSRVTRSELRRERVDMSAIARSVLIRLQHIEPERAVEIIIAEGIVMDADAGLLRILLENLLGNAWKFTSQCPLARIEVGLQKEATRTVYFVRDNGVGFDMAYVGKLFGVFQRLHSAADFDGTGIGLATVQRIVRRHGGQVWAEGAVGQGAAVYFTLNEGNMLVEQSSGSVGGSV